MVAFWPAAARTARTARSAAQFASSAAGFESQTRAHDRTREFPSSTQFAHPSDRNTGRIRMFARTCSIKVSSLESQLQLQCARFVAAPFIAVYYEILLTRPHRAQSGDSICWACWLDLSAQQSQRVYLFRTFASHPRLCWLCFYLLVSSRLVSFFFGFCFRFRPLRTRLIRAAGKCSRTPNRRTLCPARLTLRSNCRARSGHAN